MKLLEIVENEGRAVFSFSFFRVGCMRWGLDAGILVKGAMRHLWKIANRAFIAFGGEIFL